MEADGGQSVGNRANLASYSTERLDNAQLQGLPAARIPLGRGLNRLPNGARPQDR